MNRLYFIPLYLLSLSGFAQYIYKTDLSKFNSSKLRGTLLLAAVGRDGIILAADSRLNISGSVGDSLIQVGYLDNFKKIFPANKYAIAVSGVAYSHDVSVKIILDSFLLSKPVYTHPASFLALFIQFTQKNYKDFYLSLSSLSKILCVGYYENKAYLAYSYNDSVFIASGYTITSQTNGSFKKNYNKGMSCKSLKKLAISTIDSFPILNPDKKYHIGGKTQVFRINPNSTFTWLTDSGRLVYWNTYKSYIRSYLSDKLKITFIRSELKPALTTMYKEILSGELVL